MLCLCYFQSHSRSPISVAMEILYAISYVRITVTSILSCTVSNTWQIIGPTVAVDRGGCLLLMHSFGVKP